MLTLKKQFNPLAADTGACGADGAHQLPNGAHLPNGNHLPNGASHARDALPCKASDLVTKGVGSKRRGVAPGSFLELLVRTLAACLTSRSSWRGGSAGEGLGLLGQHPGSRRILLCEPSLCSGGHSRCRASWPRLGPRQAPMPVCEASS